MKILKRIYNRLLRQLNPTGFIGRFSWDEATKRSEGYSSAKILEVVVKAAREVRKGNAAYERDGKSFTTPQLHWPVVTALSLARSRNSEGISVIDVGGSLGSQYYQTKILHSYLGIQSWNVVEQSSFAKMGKEEFEDGVLKFFEALPESFEKPPSVILFKGSLQYLHDPSAIIRTVLNLNPQFLLLDQIPVSSGPSFVTVQKVPPEIYTASYPCWIFNEDDLMTPMRNNYRLGWQLNGQMSIPCMIEGFERNFGDFMSYLWIRKDIR